MKIVEVTSTLPFETFIQRHVQAMYAFGTSVVLVARYQVASTHALASLDMGGSSLSLKVMPNFNHLGVLDKVLALRYLTVKGITLPYVLGISQKVLLGYFERLRPDLIHFHTAGLAAMMAWIPKALGIPYTVSLRGSDVQVLPLQSREQCEKIAQAIIGAQRVHAVCKALGEVASEWLGVSPNISVIYTTVPVPSTLPSRENLRNTEKIHFLSSGRFVWHKSFDNLLLALHELRRQGVNACLTLVGSGPDWEHLLYMRRVLGLEEVVQMPGKLTYGQIQELFSHAHAYIQSSIAEGLSNSLVEAMANGLPVFATDVGGTREVIEDGETGFLLSPFEPQTWVEKFSYSQDPKRMERVRTAAYDKARELFSAERHARQFADFYHQALS